MTEFNAAQYLDSVNRDNIESKYTPVPAGDYPAALQIDTLTIEPVPFKDGRVGARFRVKWQIDGEVAGMTNPKVRQDFLLDVARWESDGNGGERPILKTGKNQNIALGKLIELSGQKADEWTYRGLGAARGLIKVTHRADKDDPEKVYAEVKAVAPLA